MPEQPTPPRTDGRASRWDDHKQERRQRILDAGIAVLEAHPPGYDLHVAQIAQAAGMARSVLYRHFVDRADLDRSLQRRILDDLRAQIEPGIDLDGTIEQIIFRIVDSYVGWAADHVSLHWHLEQVSVPGDDDQVARSFVTDLSEQVTFLIQTAANLLGVELDEDTSAALDPLAFGVVGQVHESVRRWLHRAERTPPRHVLSTMLAQSVWFVLDGHAKQRGIDLDPTLTIEQLVLRSAEQRVGPLS